MNDSPTTPHETTPQPPEFGSSWHRPNPEAPFQPLPPRPFTRGGRPVRSRTVIFGLVALAISVTQALTILTSIRVDGATLTLVVLLGTGAALLAAGITTAIKESRTI